MEERVGLGAQEHSLRDGRVLQVRLATLADLSALAAAHPLPRKLIFPERPCRTYYAGKARVYVTTPRAGIITGWVGAELAGFIFFSADYAALQRSMRSGATLCWVLGQWVRGCFGGPREWWTFIRWALQHERSPEQGQGQTSATDAPLPSVQAWIGTVHTVETFRRLGVASALMDVVETVLRELDATQVALWVATDNETAAELYEKRGYVRLTCVGRIGEDCWAMAKQLTLSGETAP